MANIRFNMIEHMNYAWENKQKLSLNEYQESCRNLLSHAFAELNDIICADFESKNKQYNDEVFYLFQRIIVYFMKCDDEFLQGEYDAYIKICEWIKIQPLSVKDVNALYERTAYIEIVNDIALIKSFRDVIDEKKYEAMIIAFCFLSLLGDNSFDESEYYIIRCFYDEKYDYVPKTWNKFKREWQ